MSEESYTESSRTQRYRNKAVSSPCFNCESDAVDGSFSEALDVLKKRSLLGGDGIAREQSFWQIGGFWIGILVLIPLQRLGGGVPRFDRVDVDRNLNGSLAAKGIDRSVDGVVGE